MNILEVLYASTAREAFGLLNWLVDHVFIWSPIWFWLYCVIGVPCFFAGVRLKKFNHPDKPLLSPVVRSFLGQPVYLLGVFASFALVSLFFTVVTATTLGASAQAAINDWMQWPTIKIYFEKIWPLISAASWAAFAGLIMGGGFAAVLVFRTIPLLERGKGLRDVRYMSRLFKKIKSYDSQKFIDIQKGVFVGLEDGKHPVYVPLSQFHETHTQVIGASGSGKGIALGVLGYQFALSGECVIAFDPKGDKRLPMVIAQAAKKAGKKFWFLDLRPDAPVQFNLISGAEKFEIEELLVAGLGLQPTAGDADYYRGIDQDAAATTAQFATSLNELTIGTLLQFAMQDERIEKAENFIRRLRQLSQLPAIQTSYDFDFEGLIARGDVLYIRGSTDNHRVKTLQTMLLIRILQIIKKRESGPKVALILDEFKHLLCSVSLDALGTVRELGCHAILAHQSMGDLGACPGLRREDVEPRVVDNTTLKLVYRLNDAKASADFAARSGKQRTYSEGVRGLDQDNKDQRTWTEVQQFRMSEDLFTHLHRPSDGDEVVAAGVLFGYKTARLLAVSPINAIGPAPSAIAAPLETIVKPLSAEALI